MAKNILYALVSAIIMWLAWPPIPYTAILLLIGLFPLLVAVENIHYADTAKKGRKVFLLSGLTFLTWNTASIYWIWNASPEGAIVAYLLGALLMTLAFFLYFKIKQITKPFIADLSLIGFWISYEYLHQSWDLNFPWMTLGNGFAAFPQLIQWYEYTGVYGGTVWIIISNLILLNIWRSLRNSAVQKRKLYLQWGLFSLWIAAPIIFSVITYQNYTEEENPSHIVVVQPNVDPYQKYGSLPVSEQLHNLSQLSKSEIQANTEFVIWPETALPEYINESEISNHSLFFYLQDFLRPYPNLTLITGAETFLTYQTAQTPSAKLYNGNTYWDSFNTAIAIENSNKIQFHHKSKLVPGVEKMPFTSVLAFMKPVFSKFGGTTGGYGYQEKPSVLYSRSGIGAAAAICYESIWGDWISEYIKDGAQFIAVITNDGWWGNTTGKDQHLQYARLRAIETRRWVARSANTGISAFINQRGDIVQQTEWWVPASIQQEINLNSELTFYTKYPDFVIYPFLVIGITGIFYLLISMLFAKKRAKNTT